ncbi:MAG: anaerobic ribonucleoside-triphosphate reductase activating protein [Bacilli bacterium]
MLISGFDKVTLLNYPGLVACTIFTKGCNLKCPFCHNSSLISGNDDTYIDEDEIFKYLNKRKNIIEGVCISGGEPLLQKDIKEFIRKIKSLGLKVKLDTNGTNPDLILSLINDNLLDYIAMDIKNIKSKYELTSGAKVKIDNILKSINIIENSGIDYEFRTTIIKEFHTLSDIDYISKKLDKKSKYYIQNFVKSDAVLDKNLHSFTSDELKEMKQILNNENIIFRDL